MRTSKVQTVYGGQRTGAVHYVNAGLTRQATQKSAVVRSHQYNLAFCPTELVDQQLDYICKMGKVCADFLTVFPFPPLLDVLTDTSSNTLRDGGIRLRPRPGSTSLSRVVILLT